MVNPNVLIGSYSVCILPVNCFHGNGAEPCIFGRESRQNNCPAVVSARTSRAPTTSGQYVMIIGLSGVQFGLQSYE